MLSVYFGPCRELLNITISEKRCATLDRNLCYSKAKFVIIFSPVSLYELDADFTSAVFKKFDSFEVMPNGMFSFFHKNSRPCPDKTKRLFLISKQ